MHVRQEMTQILEARKKNLEDARQVVLKAKNEGREMSGEEEQTYDKLFAAAAEQKKQHDKLQEILEAEAETERVLDAQRPPVPLSGVERLAVADEFAELLDKASDRGRAFLAKCLAGTEYAAESIGDEYPKSAQVIASDDYRYAFWKRLSGKALTQNEKKLVSVGIGGLERDPFAEKRSDLASDVDDQGGYLTAPIQFVSGIIAARDKASRFRQWARTFSVPGADKLGVRKRTAKASSYARGAEVQAPTADTALRVGQKELEPSYWTSKIIVSRDLLRRGAIAVESFVREQMDIDIREAKETEYFSANGNSAPLGLFVASADGISTARDVSTDNTTTAITFEGLYEAKYAHFRYWGNTTRWLFHQDGHKQIAKIFDADGRPIWSESVRAGEPDRLLGFPAEIHEDVPNTFTTGLYVGILGNFEWYWIADSLLMEVQRLLELHSDTNQVGWTFRGKDDGMPILEEAFTRVQLA